MTFLHDLMARFDEALDWPVDPFLDGDEVGDPWPSAEVGGDPFLGPSSV
ncbi:MAG: hypothetical protein Q8K58_11330 [Acidimicrobiales bacterium]|nr:hypothetical protein [Acidimicrobiales bacterium]